MTDKEIIKALEGCWLEGNCEYCPMKKDNKCKAILRQIALDLINRKDSKIAELTEENNHQQAEIEKLQMMIDSDNEVCTECHCEYMDKVHQARIEAIKEFARRLKAKAKDEFMYDYKMLTMATEFVVVKEIDNLVKEMVGETK